MSELGLGSAGWIAGGGSFAGTGKIVGETLAGAGGVLRVASGIGFAIWLFLEPLCVPLNSSEAEWIEAIEKKQQEELRREELRKKLLQGIVTANPNISQAELEKRVEMLLNILVDRANTIYNPYENTINRLKAISTEGSSALDDSAEIDLQPWPGFAVIGGGGKEPDKKPDKDPKKTGAKVVAGALTAAQLANMLNVSQKQDNTDQVIAPFDPSHITRVTDTGTGQVVIEYKDGTRRIFDKKDVPGQVVARTTIGADRTNTEGAGKAKNISVIEVTPPGAKNPVRVYTDSYAQVNKGKIEVYIRGKIKQPDNYNELKIRAKELEKLKKANPSEFTKEMNKELKACTDSVHNYERSKAMGKLLDDAGIVDTVENNEKIAKIILDSAKEVTSKNTKIRSTINIGTKSVIVESWWIIDENGIPYCSTIILIEVK